MEETANGGVHGSRCRRRLCNVCLGWRLRGDTPPIDKTNIPARPRRKCVEIRRNIWRDDRVVEEEEYELF